MVELLSTEELVRLVRGVFAPTADDRALAVLTDLPDERVANNDAWALRREIARDWTLRLHEARGSLGLDAVSLAHYGNVRRNNADLPATAELARADDLASGRAPGGGETVAFEDLFSSHQILIALTHFSATAPLKLAARTHRFRAATMPGFGPAMVPALRLDYNEIGRRCEGLKTLLDAASSAQIALKADGRPHELNLDLRHRSATVSGGLLREPGMAGNLPSGETYIVPYEGERPNDSSQSRGTLPVQFGDEVVVYRIEGNRAVEVIGEGPRAGEERRELTEEPAYGNLAELGFGVLADYGLDPIGEILLDEKLGLHIAFGRSDHFGGSVGASDFSKPEKVVHIDRVYIPAIQPRVLAAAVDLVDEDGTSLALMRDGRYVTAL